MGRFKDYFQEGVLDVKNPLFVELAKDPLWWRMIREDTDLYVNIRKYNRINVYFRGASVMSLEYDDTLNSIKALIHNYYLGVDKQTALKLGVPYRNVFLSPQEIVCRMDLIKSRIKRNYKFKSQVSDTDNGDSQSEKYIQANLYKSGKYIDTEFQVQLDNGTDIRIDLISLTEDNLLQFEELKRISDNRLMSSSPENSEILVQMASYADFIRDVSALKSGNELLVVKYYQTLLDIMDMIRVLPSQLKGRKVRGLSEFVNLYIDCSAYTKQTAKRKNRLTNLDKILQKRNIRSNMDDVWRLYNKLPK